MRAVTDINKEFLTISTDKLANRGRDIYFHLWKMVLKIIFSPKHLKRKGVRHFILIGYPSNWSMQFLRFLHYKKCWNLCVRLKVYLDFSLLSRRSSFEQHPKPPTKERKINLSKNFARIFENLYTRRSFS